MSTDKERKYVTEIGEIILKQLKRDPRFIFWGIDKASYVPIRRDRILYAALEFSIHTDKYPNDCLVRLLYDKEDDSYIVEVEPSRDTTVEHKEHIDAFRLHETIDSLII